ncbi:hypothetical protein [Sulfurospirillum sp. 1612]|uniref:hypothetical protein n=1 Tax=Sulfurospirillum sp. 1612 TaxID=3094835 RepID=UPI002F940DD5
MDATILNTLRDPAGVPFYPVVFQALYILTWALHIAFVLLAMGSMGLSLFGRVKQKTDTNWKILTPHLIQTGKLSVSILIVLGVAPLLFTQVIYDPNWYVTNALSGVWVFSFIYIMIVAYAMYYWYYYANKKDSSKSTLIGSVSFLLFLCAGVLMHVFSVEAIQPDKWMQWYAPQGRVDTSGLSFHLDFIRLAFMVSLSLPVVGIFLKNYSNFLSTRADFSATYIDFCNKLGTKLSSIGLVISAVLFVLWMLQINLLFSPLSLAIIISVLLLLFMVMRVKKSYYTTGFLVIVALLISGMREFIKYTIMVNHGYDIYNYPMNIDWPSVIMFLLTFVFLGFTGVGFITTMAWKVGKTQGIFDASKDVVVTKLANATLIIVSVWCVIYFGWGMFALFKNTL